MGPNWVGITLTLITLLLISGTIVAHPYIKKVTNKYYFWLGIGVVLLIYVVLGRFQYNFRDFWNSNDKEGITASKGLLLDLCPFVAFVLPITLILDPTRKTSCVLAYYGIFGGIITFLGNFCVWNDFDSINAKWDFQWIFLGDDMNRMYFMMHFILLFISPFVLLNSKRTWWLDISCCVGFILMYFGYVLICAHKFDVYSNATGLVPGDWELGGEYENVASFLHLPYPWIVVVAYSLVTLLIISWIFLFWWLQKNKKYIYTYKINELFTLK
ncbi:MAG: DUF5378 domain-containing protein [Mycoplasmataceae bacterium]|jgi:hypothetical protein|nr:DUF5378 domain-containing protein [Mycoplasmataceae bacterium]